MSDPNVRFDVHVPDHQMAGEYANLLNVWHTAHEFTLDFASTMPPETAVDEHGDEFVRVPVRVVQRVKVPPTLLFEIIRALNDNMTRYEEAFGPIQRFAGNDPLFPPADPTDPNAS
ncbi:MAG: DUF3467 domain-containing protein [Acidimicrobiia bacterium]